MLTIAIDNRLTWCLYVELGLIDEYADPIDGHGNVYIFETTISLN